MGWLIGGRLCRRCMSERTAHHFRDSLCETCRVVEEINRRLADLRTNLGALNTRIEKSLGRQEKTGRDS